MNCELCKAKPAETAIHVEKNGVEEELYVCKDCAKAERLKKQKKSQSTRKDQGSRPGVTMSITRIGGGGEPPPPVLEAILDAVHGFVSELEAGSGEGAKAKAKPALSPVSVKSVDLRYRIGGALHLEALSLIGEIQPVKRAAEALEMELSGMNVDDVPDAGHAYVLRAPSPGSARARNFLAAVLHQEENARVRLLDEMPRVFGDSVCRALAVLKNCRLLSPGELFDLLSPLRLAAMEGMLDGIKTPEIEKMMVGIDLSGKGVPDDPAERDKIDASRADEINERFSEVVLNEEGEETFL